MRFPFMKFAVAVVTAATVSGGAYAFTASNTVPASVAGSGSSAVSGYTITNMHYGLNATTPSNIDALTLTISPAIPSASSGKVQIQALLTSGGPTSYTCTTDAIGTTVTCPTTAPQLAISTLTSVTIVAAQ